MIIKLFENFTNSTIGRKFLLPFRSDSVVNQIRLYKISDRIYATEIKDIRVRALLFLRYQEYYECASEDFRSQKFSIDQYINWYMEYTKNKDLFTYAYDWAGFNIPSTSIEECIESIYDKNEYDRIMMEIVRVIRMEVPDGDFYLLGVDSIKSDILKHEVAHGMYFTNISYRSRMDKLTRSLPKDTHDSLKNQIMDMGYNEIVVNDEIQAYMSTGLFDTMEEIPNVKVYLPKYRRVFREMLSGISSPKRITLEW